jgi:hypothetical protein
MPPLMPGTRYAWAVRAIAYDGSDELRIFENNGLSEIREFKIEDWCPQPVDIKARAEKNVIFLEWTSHPQILEYVVSYRHRDVPDAMWYDERTRGSNVMLRGLRAGTWAEYKIGTVCRAGSQPVYGKTYEIEMKPEFTPNPNCGLDNCNGLKQSEIPNRERLMTLKPGDRFIAGGYYAYVTEIHSNKDGVYNGVVKFEYPQYVFNGIRVNGNMVNVVVNTDYRKIEGKIVMFTFEDKQNAMKKKQQEDSIKKSKSVDVLLDFVIPNNPDYHYDKETETLIIMDAEGNPHTVELPKNEDGTPKLPAKIADKDGNIYSVEQKNNEKPETVTVTKVTSSSQEEPVEEYMKNFYFLYYVSEYDKLQNANKSKYYYATLNDNVDEIIVDKLKSYFSQVLHETVDILEKSNLTVENDKPYNVYIPDMPLIHLRKKADGYIFSNTYSVDGKNKNYTLESKPSISPEALQAIKSGGSGIPSYMLEQDLIYTQYAGKEGEELKKLFDVTIKRYDDSPYILRIGDKLLSNNASIELEGKATYKLEVLNSADKSPATAKKITVGDNDLDGKTEYTLDFSLINGGQKKLTVSITDNGDKKITITVTVYIKEAYSSGFKCTGCSADPEKTRLNKAQQIIQEGTGNRAEGAAIFNSLKNKEITINLVSGSSDDKDGDAKWNFTNYRNGLKVNFDMIQLNSNCITDESIVLMELIPFNIKSTIMKLIQQRNFTDIRVQKLKIFNPKLFAEIDALSENLDIRDKYMDTIKTYFTNHIFDYPLTDNEITEGFSISNIGSVNLYVDNLNDEKRNFNYPHRRNVLDPVPDETMKNEYRQQNYTRTLVHELYHLHYQMTHPVSNIKWMVLRYEIDRLPEPQKSALIRQLCDQHSSGSRVSSNCGACSKGAAHELHNPEGKGCCCIEFNY